MTGVFESPIGPAHFDLRRTGDARFSAPPRSQAIGKEMEGTWSGKLEVDGGLRVTLTMSNQPDGTSTGSLVSVDQGGLVLPVSIVQQGNTLNLDVPMVGGSDAGALNASRTEIAGAYTTAQGTSVPLTLRKDGN
jgi:hypothetical protein